MDKLEGLWVSLPIGLLLFLSSTFITTVPGALAWSKEGHVMACQIAHSLLEAGTSQAGYNLLPAHVEGNLSALCVWPDQIRHWHKYSWTRPLHFIDTLDDACSFKYSRDCKDTHGVTDMCVAGAIKNFTSQLLHYAEGTADRRYNMTEALLFLSHFVGDIHQDSFFSQCMLDSPSDEGGNTIELRWFRRKSNLHHVWDRDIILQALKDYYDKDTSLLLQDIQRNYTDGIWSDDVSSWEHCNDISRCVNNWAKESIEIACKWGYEGAEPGTTLADEYFDSRMPFVMKRIAQAGVRLAMILNQVFADSEQGFESDE